MDNWERPFIRSWFSESDGSGSNTRVCVFLVVLASLLILGYLAWKKPDVFTAAITLLTAFDVAVIAALYGINKLSSGFEKFLDAKKDGPNA